MLNDDYFMRKATQHAEKPTYDKKDLMGIANEQQWTLDRLAAKEEVASEDKFQIGDAVSFNHENFKYSGRIASKQGQDWIVQIQPGESFLVPEQYLVPAKVSADQIRQAMATKKLPTITKVAEHQLSDTRFITEIQFRERRPDDNELMVWASENVPHARLVDASDRGNRTIGLIFEKQANLEISSMEPMGDKDGMAVFVVTGHSHGSEFEAIVGVELTSGNLRILENHGLEASEEELQHALDQTSGFHEEAVVGDKCWLCKGKGGHKTGSEPSWEDCRNCHGTGKEPPAKPEPKKTADADVMPQGGDQVNRGRALSSEELEGTGVFQHQAASNDQELEEAARWILGRFNAANPNYSAVPGSIEVADNGNVLRLSFALNSKAEDDTLGKLYMTRTGEINAKQGTPVEGFIQVDAAANMPMIMLNGPTGPQNVQTYGFNFTAGKVADIVAACADEVLEKHNGYSKDAEHEFYARLDKMAVDQATKDYWGKYFGSYGEQWTRKIPRSIDKMASRPLGHEDDEDWSDETYQKQKKEKQDLFKRLDDQDKERKQQQDKERDYAIHNRLASIAKDAVIRKEKGKYCVKSPHNPDWNGGCYDSKEEAEKRLKQVEYFKHKGEFDKSAVDIHGLAEWATSTAANDPEVMNYVSSLLMDWMKKHPNRVMDFHQMDKTEALAAALSENKRALNGMVNVLKKTLGKEYQSLKHSPKDLLSDAEHVDDKDIVATKTAGYQELPPEAVEDAREWCHDVFGGDEDVTEEIDQASPEVLEHNINKHYDGGVRGFLQDMGYAVASHDDHGYPTASKQADVHNNPSAYNSSSKDDRKDYDHKDKHLPPARTRTRFYVNRMYSTTASEDNGYLLIDLEWDPENFKEMSSNNVKHQIVSFIKGLESDKYYHDFGVLGKPKIVFMDLEEGMATVKVRSSESRNVITLNYNNNDEYQPLTGL